MSIYREDTQFQPRSGTTGEHATFVGEQGEFTVDITKHTGVIHDGVTPGGHPLATEQALNEHEAETTSHWMGASRDASIEGVQSLQLTDNMLPKVIFVDAVIPGTESVSRGKWSPSGQHCLYLNGDAIDNRVTNLAVRIAATNTDRIDGTIQNVTKDGFEINWVTAGAGATGTISFRFLIIYHGE